MERTPSGAEDAVKILEARYEQVCHERDRLRAARGFFAQRLGPIPASAGISTALVTALAADLVDLFVWLALALLVLIVAIGMWYGGKPAYRHLYALKGGPAASRPASPDESYATWLTRMIALEQQIAGDPVEHNEARSPWAPVTTLREGLDSERTGLIATQILWLLVIACLVLAVLLK